MKIDTLESMLDTRPLYEALAELSSYNDIMPKSTRRFLIARMRYSIRSLRSTLRHVEERLDETAPRKPRKLRAPK